MAKRKRSEALVSQQSKVAPDLPVTAERTGIPPDISPCEIARVAYDLWEREGCVHGNDVKHWLEAERILRGQSIKGRSA